MATEPFSALATAGRTVYFRFMDLANFKVFDFDDDAWEVNLAACTDPKLAATEKTDLGDADESLYVASTDLSAMNSTTTPMTIAVQAVDDLATDEIMGTEEMTVVSGTKRLAGQLDAVKVKTDQLMFTTEGKVDTRVDYVGGNAVTTPDDFKADISGGFDAVWDSVLASHKDDGSFGEAIGLITLAVGVSGSLYPYPVTEAGSGAVVEGATVYVSTDVDGDNRLAVGVSDNVGVVKFYLTPGTYYFWPQHPDIAFPNNPDTKVVS